MLESSLDVTIKDQTIEDLAFFLDEYGPTHAVRAKLEEQGREIRRLRGHVKQLLLLLSGRTPSREWQEEERISTTGEENEQSVAGIMTDLDFFFRKFGSTRAVRLTLENQKHQIVSLKNTLHSYPLQGNRNSVVSSSN
ncbi:hypothetical protein V7S43_016813 [Phytophthora oleae]|uniref:VPS37 C-terminal domain-containing protein n=1 Tax=Phytophthora oleae TaxID=2107226 RepID=A0ABD3EUI2_9STRA